jgi:hypothetical protein
MEAERTACRGVQLLKAEESHRNNSDNFGISSPSFNQGAKSQP